METVEVTVTAQEAMFIKAGPPVRVATAAGAVVGAAGSRGAAEAAAKRRERGSLAVRAGPAAVGRIFDGLKGSAGAKTGRVRRRSRDSVYKDPYMQSPYSCIACNFRARAPSCGRVESSDHWRGW